MCNIFPYNAYETFKIVRSGNQSNKTYRRIKRERESENKQQKRIVNKRNKCKLMHATAQQYTDIVQLKQGTLTLTDYSMFHSPANKQFRWNTVQHTSIHTHFSHSIVVYLLMSSLCLGFHRQKIILIFIFNTFSAILLCAITTNRNMVVKTSKTWIRNFIMSGRCVCDYFNNSVAVMRNDVSISSSFQLKTVCFIFHEIASAH